MEGEELLVGGEGGGAASGGEGGGTAVADDLDIFETDSSADSGAADDKGSTDDQGVVDDTQGDDDKGERQPEKIDDKEEPEVQEFRGLVSGKLRNIIKKAPELGNVLSKYPEVKNLLEATMRRDAAMREIYPTVAEARAMRDQFPNGKADVEALLEDVREVEQIDKDFDTADVQGNYPGHTKLIENFVARDKNAAIALFKTLPKEWAKIDPASYNEVMGKIVASTFSSRQIPEFISGLIEDAKEGGDENKGLVASLERLLGWVNSYSAEKPRPTEGEERLARERAEFDRRQNEATKQQRITFHNNFLANAKSLQLKAIKDHRVIKKLESLTSLDAAKKADIIEKIRQAGEQHLASSPSFMKKIREAHAKGDLKQCEEIQRAAWSMPWLLNRMIRTVMHKEVPQLIRNNREVSQRRAGAQRTVTPANSGDKKGSNASKGPVKIGGRWYRENGVPFTTAEVLAGKHLS